jgi:hypothetical protein
VYMHLIARVATPPVSSSGGGEETRPALDGTLRHSDAQAASLESVPGCVAGPARCDFYAEFEVEELRHAHCSMAARSTELREQ